ncbi:MAG: hypothetical protein U9O94_05285 [Nanoarchaeota archaeon]|nr:hypothetical protein [Nanoarchaeota archaeon]
MNKKGALALSVNAIVVLILAVVMLGLALGFVKGMFGKVTTSFEEQIAAEPEPPTSTGSEPVTLSRESLIVHSGDDVVLKVGIYNPSSEAWTATAFAISCKVGGNPIGLVTESNFNSKEIAQGSSISGAYLFTVGSIGEGTHLCTGMVIGTGDTATHEYSKEIVIKVLR